MQFAEMAREVKIARPTPDYTPVRHGFRIGRGGIFFTFILVLFVVCNSSHNLWLQEKKSVFSLMN